MNEFSYINLIQYCAAAVFVIDKEHRVVNWNQACEKLTGTDAISVIGTKNHWRAFYDHPRPCLSDLIIDNNLDQLEMYYEAFGKSKLLSSGWQAEGWYPNLGDARRYIFFDAAPIYDRKHNLIGAIETLKDITNRKIIEEENKALARKLQISLNKIKILKGLLPICAKCKKIRDDKGSWHQLEVYISKHYGAEFSHGICPECAKMLYPDFVEDKESEMFEKSPPI